MTASNVPRGSKLRTPKPPTSPSDLADQFLELQRLRKKVYELEKLMANDSQQGATGGGTDPVERPK